MPLSSGPENHDPNQAAYQDNQQQWADELRRADERCNKFKAEIEKMSEVNLSLQSEIQMLNGKVMTRD
jgi:hypothetical protein